MGFVIKRQKTQQQLLGKSSAHKKLQAAKTKISALVSPPANVNDLTPKLVIEQAFIEKLKPAKRRSRKPYENHVANVMKILLALGQVSPILIDSEWRIVDGHVVAEALRRLGATHVSVVRLDHLNEAQLRLVRIAINKLQEGSEWDLEDLRLDLQYIDQAGFDLGLTGFSPQELDIVLQEPAAESVDSDLNDSPEPPKNPTSRLGDLWLLGMHRLLCGNSLEKGSYILLLGTDRADAGFTDCPWNLPGKMISGKHGNFKMAAGEMTGEAFQDFCDTFTKLIAEYLKDGSVLFSVIDWRSCSRIEEAGRKAGLKHIGTAVWNKQVGAMGGFYRAQHEFIPYFVKGDKPKTNNIALGKHGRDRTNVWTYPGANQRGSSAAKALHDHPTPKPIELVADALLDVTLRGDLVLDVFLGSGTTLLAAEKTGRVAAAIELDPAYVDVAIRRWEEMTGKQAMHAESGMTFAELTEQRASEPVEGECDDVD